MIRCVVFDLDGTLVDIGDLFYRLYGEVVRASGLDPINFKRIGGSWLSAHTQTMETYPKLCGIAAEPVFADTWERVLQEMLSAGRVRLYPEARQILHALRVSERTICLATNTPKRFVEIKLDYFELRDFFDAVFTPQDSWGGKPKPDSLLHVMERFGLAPQEIVMVGDHDQDITYGKNAGVKTVGVLNQDNTREQLASAGADWIVEGLRELMDIVI